MSSYISSFLIDPVYRQARRFSRLSATSDSSQPAFSNLFPAGQPGPSRDLSPPPSIDEDVEGGQDTVVVEDHQDTVPLGRGRRQIPSPPPESSSTGAAAVDRGQSRVWDNSPGLPLDRSVFSSRRGTARTDSDSSSNPSYGIRESLLSSRGTLMDTSRDAPGAIALSAPGSAEAAGGNEQRHSGDWVAIAAGGLPEDDGMKVLRTKIHEIRRMDVSHDEKARLIHTLMTEQWNLSLISVLSPLRPHSPASLASQERPFTPQSLTDQRPYTPTSLSSAANPENPYNITPEDAIPTYAPKLSIRNQPGSQGNPLSDEILEEDGEPELGCPHYKRNVKLQCHTCKRWYTCRFCHDEAEDHTLIRTLTENMLCMLCGCAQPAGQWCKKCGESTAWYYCDTCKLWDNDSEKSIYHCNDCGICRVGKGIGKDFFHCKTCCACMSISTEGTHRCIERSTQCDCPICGEYMFTSPDTVVFMRCGHSIHNKCFFEYSKTSYKCPICSRSITNMETQFRNLDRTIRSQPMPLEFRDTKALVYCNDCSAKTAVSYHWLGLKCDVCDSYNTAQLQLINTNNSDTPSAGAVAAAAAAASAARGAAQPLPQETVPVDEVTPASLISTAHVPVPLNRVSSPIIRSGNEGSSLSLSPYIIPQRAGRSVSGMIGNYFGMGNRASSPSATPTLDADNGDDSDADSVDFWGGESPRNRSRVMAAVEDEDIEEDLDIADDDDEDDDDDMEEEDDDDDGDEADQIDIFGHR